MKMISRPFCSKFLPLFSMAVWLMSSLSAYGEPSTKEIVEIFVSPDGNDANDGSSPSRPIATINQAQNIVQDLLDQGLSPNVDVLFLEGEYRDQHVVWETIIPGKKIQFLPYDWRQSPRFISNESFKKPFFVLSSRTPHTGKIRIINLTIEHYSNAILLKNVDVAEIIHNTFLGTGGFVNGMDAPGTIILDNSNRNRIHGNRFYTATSHPTNPPSRCDVSAIYLYGSSKNHIVENSFKSICGPVVTFQNASNDNWVLLNRYLYTGTRELFSAKSFAGECPNLGNKIQANRYCYNFFGDAVEVSRVEDSQNVGNGCETQSPGREPFNLTFRNWDMTKSNPMEEVSWCEKLPDNLVSERKGGWQH